MKTIIFTGHGNPLPKQSFKVGRGGKGYTPQRIKDWQTMVSMRAKEAMAGAEPIHERLAVTIEFRRADNRRVDIDNLSKAVLDGMNGIVFDDDRQVTQLYLNKLSKDDCDKQDLELGIVVGVGSLNTMQPPAPYKEPYKADEMYFMDW